MYVIQAFNGLVWSTISKPRAENVQRARLLVLAKVCPGAKLRLALLAP
ncbi:hypothetical protein [Bradyrhizobium sp. 153]|nr:hypothetical protein [Bradyrhizobium sp. 153]MCK1668672.1 hypothetical protein [Bradyrhizobium sp. 153]